MSQSSAAKPGFFSRVAHIGLWSAWTALGLFGFSTAVMIVIVQFLPHDALHYVSKTTPGILISTAFLYAIALASVVGIPLLIRRWRKQEMTRIRTLLGAHSAQFRYFVVVPVVWLIYLIVSNIIISIATRVPGFNADQQQDIGFSTAGTTMDMTIAFIGLVIIAPLAEELLFRGYLFGKLRSQNGFWISAIFTSVVFGIVHGQWNVGVDVFVLSLFLCALRERSGSVWPGVFLHATKNGVAYFFLFIAPLLGWNLVQ